MATERPKDPLNRRIPESKEEGTFDRNLNRTLDLTVRQVNELEDTLDEVMDRIDEVPGEDFAAGDQLSDVESRLSSLEEEVGEIGQEDPDETSLEVSGPETLIGEAGPGGQHTFVFDTDDSTDRALTLLAKGRGGPSSLSVTPTGTVFGSHPDAAPGFADHDVEVQGSASVDDHLRLRGGGQSDYADLYEEDGLHLTPHEPSDTEDLTGTVHLDAKNILPGEKYETNLGSEQRKFLTLHASELWVNSLVAQKKTATIGGSIFVGPTTELTQPTSGDPEDADRLAARDYYNYIRVKHNELTPGDIVQLNNFTRIEFMRVKSGPVKIKPQHEEEGGEDNPFDFARENNYRYEVERDLDGSGVNPWDKGAAVASTGTKGEGFIEQYSREDRKGNNEVGPTLAIHVREDDESTWTGAEDEYFDEWYERSAIGNLKGLYDYSSDVYGVAGGRYENSWFSVDEDEGFRLMSQDTLVGQWDTDGTVRVGPYRSGISAHPLVIDSQGNLTTYGDLRMPDGDGGYQRPANWQGPWLAGVSYEKGDAVSYDGQTYICRTAHTSSTSDGDNDTAEPDDSAYWEIMTEAASQAYIATPNGSAIKNSTSNLEVKAQLITGPSEKTLSDTSGYALVDEGGTDISTYASQASQATSGEMHYELTPSDIGSSLVIHLNDPDGNQVGTVTLIDVTESIIGTTTVLSGDRSYYRPPGGSWETGTTTFEAQFTQGATVDATAESDVSWDGTEWTITPDPSGTNPSSIDVQYWDGSAWTTVTSSTTVSTNATGQSFEIRWKYTNPSGITQHVGTNVTAIEGGTDSQLVRLEAPSRVFKQKKDGTHDPADITLEAHSENIASPSYVWEDGSGTQLGTGSTVTINHSDLSSGSLEVVLKETGTTLTDSTTLVEVIEGTDAITVVVSNASHTFPAESDGQVTSYDGADATVEVYEGATKLDFDGTASPAASTFSVSYTPADTDGDGNDDVTGTTSTSDTNGDTTDDAWTFAPDSMESDVENTTVALEVTAVRSDGSTETHTDQLTYTKAKVAQGMRLSSSSQIIRLNKDGSTDNDPITLTASRQNVTETTSWSTDNSVTFSSTSGDTAELQYSDFTDAGVTRTTVTADAGGFSDEITLAVVEEGTDAITSVLSNENHTFTATSDGVVTNPNTGQCDVTAYEGATQLGNGTGDGTFDVSINSYSGFSASPGSLTTTSSKYVFDPDPTLINADAASVELKIDVRRADGSTETIYRTISYVRTKKSESPRIRASSLTITENKDGSHSPTSIDLTGLAPNSDNPTFNWDTTGDGTFDTTNTNPVTITNGDLDNQGGSVEVTMKETNTGTTDSVTLTEVVEGTDSVQTVLGNENHTYATDHEGSLVGSIDSGDCAIEVYEGATKLSQDGTTDPPSSPETFSITNVSETSGLSSDALDTSNTDKIIYQPSALTEDNATAELTIKAKRADGTVETIVREITYTKARQGNPSQFYYIRSLNGRVIRNSDPSVTLDLETISVDGPSESVWNPGDGSLPALHTYEDANNDGNKTYEKLGTASSSLDSADPYQPSIGADQIGDGTRKLYFYDGSKVLDSITLTDLTDVINGVTEVVNGSTVFTKGPNEDWGTETVDLGANFYVGSSKAAALLVQVEYDGPNDTWSKDETVTDSGFDELNTGDVTATLLSTSGTSTTIEYEFTHPDHGGTQKVRETITAVSAGDDSVQRIVRSENGTVIKNTNGSITLQAVRIEGESETNISSTFDSTYKIRTKEGTDNYQPVSNNTSASSDYNPTLDENDINGRLVLYLGDGTAQADQVGSVSLADITDGLSTGYVNKTEAALTHLAGPGMDAVTPSSATFTGVFVDTSGTEHKQDIQFTAQEDGDDHLEVSWNFNSLTNTDADVDVTVKAQGTDLASTNSSGSVDADDATALSGATVRELIVEFKGTDPDTEESVVFTEQLQLPRDYGIYRIDPLDGTTLKLGENDTLGFEITRTDGGDGSRVLSVDGEDLTLAQFESRGGTLKATWPPVVRQSSTPTASDYHDDSTWRGGEVWFDTSNSPSTKHWYDTGSSSFTESGPIPYGGQIVLGEADIEESDVLQLQTSDLDMDGDGTVLDTKSVVDVSDGVGSGFVEIPKGSRFTYFTAPTNDTGDDVIGPGEDTSIAGPSGKLKVHGKFVAAQGDTNETIVTITAKDDGTDGQTMTAKWETSSPNHDPLSEAVSVSQIESGSNLPSGSYESTDEHWVVTFSHEDPDSGQIITWEEVIYFSVDLSTYEIAKKDDETHFRKREDTNGNLVPTDLNFSGRKLSEDIPGGEKLVTLDGSPYKLEIDDGDSTTTYTGGGDTWTINHGDFTGSATLKLIKGSTTVAREAIVDEPEGTDGADAVTGSTTVAKGNPIWRRTDEKSNNGWGPTTFDADGDGTSNSVHATRVGFSASAGATSIADPSTDYVDLVLDTSSGTLSESGRTTSSNVTATVSGGGSEAVEVEFTATNTDAAGRTREVTDSYIVQAVKDGQPARIVRLERSSDVLVRDDEGSYSPSTITLTAHTNGFTGKKSFDWSASDDGTVDSSVGDKYEAEIDATGVSQSDFPINVQVDVDGTNADNPYTDTTTVHEVVDGGNAFTVVVTNENHTFDASHDGSIDSFAGGDSDVRVYEGATRLDYDSNFTAGSFKVSYTASNNDSNDGADISGTTSTTASPGEWTFVPDSMEADVGQASLTLTVDVKTKDGNSTKSFERTISYSKAQDNQDFEYLESAASDFADDYSGLAQSNQYMGYIETLSNSNNDPSKRWRSYFDDGGNLYLNDGPDSNALEYIADFNGSGVGLFAVGNTGEAENFFDGTGAAEDSQFFGYHDGELAVNAKIAGSVGGVNSDELTLGNPPSQGITLDGAGEEIRMYAPDVPNNTKDHSVAIGPGSSAASGSGDMEVVTSKVTTNFSSVTISGSNWNTTTKTISIIGGSFGFGDSDMSDKQLPVEMLAVLDFTFDLNSALDFEIVYLLYHDAPESGVRQEVGMYEETISSGTYSDSVTGAIADRLPAVSGDMNFNIKVVTDRTLASGESFTYSSSRDGSGADLEWRQHRPRTVINEYGIKTHISPNLYRTLGGGGAGGGGGGGGSSGVSSFEGRTGDITLQNNDVTGALDSDSVGPDIVDETTSTKYSIDVDLLDGQEGSHYTDYSNFSNVSAAAASGLEDDGTGSALRIASGAAGTGLTGGSGSALSIADGGVGTTQLAGSAATNAKLANTTVSVAGNSVTLGGSTSVNHGDLSSISSDDHHTRYSNEEAQDAVGGILGSKFTYDDSDDGDSTTAPSIELTTDTVTVAGNSVALGNSTSVSHGDLSSISSGDHHVRPSAGDGLSESSNTFTVKESEVDHDSLKNFVSNEHVDHTSVSISSGGGLGGGGDISSSRTISHTTSSQSDASVSGATVISGVSLDSYAHVSGFSTEDRAVSQWAKAESDINLDGYGLDKTGVIEFNVVSQPTNGVGGKLYYEADTTNLSGFDGTGVAQGQISALGLYDSAQSAWKGVVTSANSPYWDAQIRSAETTGHVDKQTEWSISHQGRADFREVYTDELIAKTFTVDLTQALAGSDYLVKSVATLDESFTIPSESSADGTVDGGTSTLKVRDNPGAKGLPAFSEGDWLRLRVVDNSDGGLVIVDAWFKVTDHDGDGSAFVNNGNGTHTFEVQRGDSSTGPTNKTVDQEAPVLDYGQSGQGLIRRTVEGEDAPYSAIETWTGNPVEDGNYSTKVMTGNLSGAQALSNGTVPSGYGFFAAGNAYLEGEIVSSSGQIANWVIKNNRIESETSFGTVAEGGLLSWGHDTTAEQEGDSVKTTWDEPVTGFGGASSAVSAHVGVRGSSGEMLVYGNDDNYVSAGAGYHHDGGRSEMGLTVRSAGDMIIETSTSTSSSWNGKAAYLDSVHVGGDASINGMLQVGGQDLTRIYVQGTSSNNSGPRVLTVDGTEVYNTSSGRGLRLVVWSRASGIVCDETYDVYTTGGNNLGDVLQRNQDLPGTNRRLTGSDVITLTSFDRIGDPHLWSGVLEDGINQIGGSYSALIQAAEDASNPGILPYALIGQYGGSGTRGAGMQVVKSSSSAFPAAQGTAFVQDESIMHVKGQQKAHIDGNMVVSGTLTADHVDANSLFVNKTFTLGSGGIIESASGNGSDSYLQLNADGHAHFGDLSGDHIRIDPDGSPTVDITGKVTADSGNIGGWTINTSEITSGDVRIRTDHDTLQIGSLSNTGSTIDRLHFGQIKNESGTWESTHGVIAVTGDGSVPFELSDNALKIGGWSFDSSALSIGDVEMGKGLDETTSGVMTGTFSSGALNKGFAVRDSSDVGFRSGINGSSNAEAVLGDLTTSGEYLEYSGGTLTISASDFNLDAVSGGGGIQIDSSVPRFLMKKNSREAFKIRHDASEPTLTNSDAVASDTNNSDLSLSSSGDTITSAQASGGMSFGTGLAFEAEYRLAHTGSPTGGYYQIYCELQLYDGSSWVAVEDETKTVQYDETVSSFLTANTEGYSDARLYFKLENVSMTYDGAAEIDNIKYYEYDGKIVVSGQALYIRSTPNVITRLGGGYNDVELSGTTVVDWGGVNNKPFSTLGSEFSVNSDTLSIDQGAGSGLNADQVDGYHYDDLARPKNSASFTNTDTSTDINNTSWTTIPWDVQNSVDAGYTHDPANSPGEITFDNAGTYRVKAMLSYNSGNYRTNPGIRFAINGTRRNALGLSGYVRDASGHHEGSNYLEESITVSAGDTLTVQTYQYGNSGTVTMRSKESNLIIEQVSKTVAIADDADTVDGYHAGAFLLSGGDSMTGDLSMGGNSIFFASGIGIGLDGNGASVETHDGSGNRIHLETKDAYIEDASEWVGDHINSTSNPHSVTKSQVGLGNVANVNVTTGFVIGNSNALDFESGTNGEKIDVDARDDANSDVWLHKHWDSSGTPERHGEKWYDGSNYHKISAVSDGFKIHDSLTVEDGLRVGTNSSGSDEDILLEENANISVTSPTSSSKSLRFLSESGGSFAFGIGDTVRSGSESYQLGVNSTGVAVGQKSAAYLLDVGGVSANDTMASVRIQGGTTSTASDISLAEVVFGGSEGTGSGDAAAIQMLAKNDWNDNDTPSILRFQTTPNGSGSKTERMRIQADGKVGIDETSPNLLLSVGNANRGIDTWGSSSISLRQKHSSSSFAAVESLGDVRVNLDTNDNKTGKKFLITKNGAGDTGTTVFDVQESGAVTAYGDVESDDFSKRSEGWGIGSGGRGEFSSLYVRGAAWFRELDIEKLRYKKGVEISGTGGGKVQSVDSNPSSGDFGITFEEKHGLSAGDVLVALEVDDSMIQGAQSDDGINYEDPTQFAHQSFVQVTSRVDTTTIEVDMLDYADGSGGADGSDSPEVGWDYAQVGSSDSARDSFIKTDPYLPAIDIFDGMNHQNHNNAGHSQVPDFGNVGPDVRIGNLSGYFGTSGVTYGLGAGDPSTSGDYLRATASKVKVSGEIVAGSGEIADWKINTDSIVNNISSGGQIEMKKINSDRARFAVTSDGDFSGSTGNFILMEADGSSSDYTFLARKGGNRLFELGSTNNIIAGWSFTNSRIKSSNDQIELRSGDNNGEDTIFVEDSNSNWYTFLGNVYDGSWQTSTWGFSLYDNANNNTIVELTDRKQIISKWEITKNRFERLDIGTNNVDVKLGQLWSSSAIGLSVSGGTNGSMVRMISKNSEPELLAFEDSNNYVSMGRGLDRPTMGITVKADGNHIFDTSSNTQSSWENKAAYLDSIYVGGDAHVAGGASIEGNAIIGGSLSVGQGGNIVENGHRRRQGDGYPFWTETLFTGRHYCNFVDEHDNSNWNGWNDPTGIAALRDDRSYTGGISLHADASSGGPVISTNTNGLPSQIKRLKFYYNETSGSTGGGFWIKDENGNTLLKLGSNNPEKEIVDGQSSGQVHDGKVDDDGDGNEEPDYNEWYEVEITFDWDNGTYDILWQRARDGAGSWSDKNRDLKNFGSSSQSVGKLQVVNWNNGGLDSGSDIEMWFDGIEWYESDEDGTYRHLEPGDELSAQMEGRVTKNAKDAGAGVKCHITYVEESGGWYGSHSQEISTTSWSKKKWQGKIPDDVTTIKAKVYHNPSGTSTGKAFFRRLSIEKGTQHTPYARTDPKFKVYGDAVVNGTLTADKIVTDSVLTNKLLANQAEITNTLEMPYTSGDRGTILIRGQSTDDFYVGDYSISGSSSDSYTFFNSSSYTDLSVSGGSNQGDETYNFGSVDNWNTTVELTYDLDVGTSGGDHAKVELTVEILDSNGNVLSTNSTGDEATYVAGGGDVSVTGETLSVSFKMGTNVDRMRVTRYVEANSNSTATARDDAPMTASNGVDNIGPNGAVWRDSSTVQIEIAGGSGSGANTNNNGEIYVRDDYLNGSDRRLKDNIRKVEDPLQIIRSIRGVRYEKSGKASAGMIAQDFEDVFDVAVTEGEKYLSLNYNATFAPVIEATKVLDDRIESTRELAETNEDRIQELEEENERLRAKIDDLEDQE